MTRPVARYGMSSISTPDRQQAAGSVKGGRLKVERLWNLNRRAGRDGGVLGEVPVRKRRLVFAAANAPVAAVPALVAVRRMVDANPLSDPLSSRHPSPTSTIIPELSCPSICGGSFGKRPCVTWTSVPQMPVVSISTSTYPGRRLWVGDVVKSEVCATVPSLCLHVGLPRVLRFTRLV